MVIKTTAPIGSPDIRALNEQQQFLEKFVRKGSKCQLRSQVRALCL
jgi:hypothetical protein